MRLEGDGVMDDICQVEKFIEMQQAEIELLRRIVSRLGGCSCSNCLDDEKESA